MFLSWKFCMKSSFIFMTFFPRPVSAVTLIHSTRYYFGVLRLSTGRVTLSMATSSKLPSDLKVVKNSLSVPLVAFEEAKVDLGEPWLLFFLFIDLLWIAYWSPYSTLKNRHIKILFSFTWQCPLRRAMLKLGLGLGLKKICSCTVALFHPIMCEPYGYFQHEDQ